MAGAGLHKIERLPEFKAEHDAMLIAEFGAKHPHLAHVMTNISVEKSKTTFLLEELVKLNHAQVGNQETLEVMNKLLAQIVKGQEDTARQLTEVQRVSSENAKTILDWTIRFKSPLAIVGSIFAVIATAGFGAFITHFFEKK